MQFSISWCLLHICNDNVIKLAFSLDKTTIWTSIDCDFQPISWVTSVLVYSVLSLPTTQILTTLCYRKSRVRSVNVTTSHATETTACCVRERSKGPACAASASVWAAGRAWRVTAATVQTHACRLAVARCAADTARASAASASAPKTSRVTTAVATATSVR